MIKEIYYWFVWRLTKKWPQGHCRGFSDKPWWWDMLVNLDAKFVWLKTELKIRKNLRWDNKYCLKEDRGRWKHDKRCKLFNKYRCSTCHMGGFWI